MARRRCRIAVIIFLQTCIIELIVWNANTSEIAFPGVEKFARNSGPITIDAATLFSAPNTRARLLFPVDITRRELIFQLLMTFILSNGQLHLTLNFHSVCGFRTILIVKPTRKPSNERIILIVKLCPLLNAVNLLSFQMFQDVVVFVIRIVRFLKIAGNECNRCIFACEKWFRQSSIAKILYCSCLVTSQSTHQQNNCKMLPADSALHLLWHQKPCPKLISTTSRYGCHRTSLVRRQLALWLPDPIELLLARAVCRWWDVSEGLATPPPLPHNNKWWENVAGRIARKTKSFFFSVRIKKRENVKCGIRGTTGRHFKIGSADFDNWPTCIIFYLSNDEAKDRRS